MSNAYVATMQALADKKGLSADELARLDAVVRRVGWVESKNDPSAVQSSGGPGRGMFQFETAEGSGESKTAAKRLSNFERRYGRVPLPKSDRAELSRKDPDFSKLSEEGQKAVLLANWTMKTPGDEVGALARGEMDPKQFWLEYHWGGAEEDVPAKADQWDREMADYSRLIGRVN